MKTNLILIAALSVGATAAVAQSNDGQSVVYDYETVSGLNEGLTQDQFNGYDENRDGILGTGEQMRFLEDGYSNATPVDDLAEPTDGFATE